MKVLGIIPAREGSKRVPRKNFRPFAGTTLVDLAIEHALGASCLDQIVVNSDADEVERIVSKYLGKGVEFLKRPYDIANDRSAAIDYMQHTLKYYEDQNKFFDLVVIIQPSSPFRTGKDIDATVNLMREDDSATSAVSVVRIAHMLHPHKIKVLKEGELKPWLFDEGQKTAAHELPELFVRNCAVYVFKTKLLKGWIAWRDIIYFHNSLNSYIFSS